MFAEAEKANKKLISYSLFGGEPTINWEVVENAIKITKELENKTNIKCYKAIVTNGVMEDFKSDFLSKNFDFIYFSLDGPKELFIKQRRSNNSDKLYNIIYNNAKKIYKTDSYLSFKITVTSFTIDYLKEIDDFFSDNFPTCSRLYQPCMVDENDILYVDFSYFLEKYLELKRYSIFPKNMMNSLYKNKPSDRFCNLSIRNVIYPNGNVLSCHRSNMCIPEDKIRSEFYVGYWKDGIIYRDLEKHEYMKTFEVDNIEDCKDCIFKYHCCGGCPTIKLLSKNPNMFRKSDYCETMLKYSYTLLMSRLFNINMEYIKELPINKTVEKNEVSEKYFKDRFLNNIIKIEE